MKIESFPIDRPEPSCQLALLARDMPGRTSDVAELGKPLVLTQENGGVVRVLDVGLEPFLISQLFHDKQA